ncbi:MAG: hypothetical protein ACKVQA_00315 [Burkholderiales bacterium]
MAKVNVAMAAVVVGILLLAASPVLDPKRLSAYNQGARLSAGKVDAKSFDYDYLRFELGRYGRNVLSGLSKDSNQDIASRASASLAKKERYAQPGVTPRMLVSRIELYPAGTTLDPTLVEYLKGEIKSRGWEHPHCLRLTDQPACLMAALDLNEDKQPEILTFNSYPNAVYSKTGGQWKKIGNLDGNTQGEKIDELVRKSTLSAETPEWQDVRIGGVRFKVK